MHRRRFLATTGMVSFAGYLGGGVQDLAGNDDGETGDGDTDSSDIDSGDTDSGGIDDPSGASCLEGTPTRVSVTADAVEISFRDAGGEDEAVVLENDSGGALVLGGHRLEYDSGATYTFDSLALLPGASVAVESRGTGDATLKSCPPKYVRAAGFETAVLGDGATTVALVSDAGALVERHSPSDGG